MKLLQFILGLALFVTLISSCNEDEDTPTTPATIIGSWNLTDVEYRSVTDSIRTVTVYDTINFAIYDSIIYENLGLIVSEGSGENIDATITFGENPNVSSSTGTFDIKATAVRRFYSRDVELLDNALNADGKWSRFADDIIIQDDNNRFVNSYKFVNVTATELTLSSEFILSSIVDLSDDRKRIKRETTTINYTFKK